MCTEASFLRSCEEHTEILYREYCNKRQDRNHRVKEILVDFVDEGPCPICDAETSSTDPGEIEKSRRLQKEREEAATYEKIARAVVLEDNPEMVDPREIDNEVEKLTNHLALRRETKRKEWNAKMEMEKEKEKEETALKKAKEEAGKGDVGKEGQKQSGAGAMDVKKQLAQWSERKKLDRKMAEAGEDRAKMMEAYLERKRLDLQWEIQQYTEEVSKTREMGEGSGDNMPSDDKEMTETTGMEQTKEKEMKTEE